MKLLLQLTIAAGLLGSAAAQGLLVPEPTYEDKVNALKAAYRLNGNSMDGNGRMIDMTNPDTLNAYSALREADANPPPDMSLIFPKLDRPVKHKALKHRAKRGDVCSRHGLRKVTVRGGKSWRCK